MTNIPLIVNVPFYVIGISVNGQEKTYVLPVLERTETSEHPTREVPYIERLSVSTKYDLSEIAKALKDSPDIIEHAKSMTLKIEKSDILSGLNNLKEKGYVDNVFVEAVDKFWGEIYG